MPQALLKYHAVGYLRGVGGGVDEKEEVNKTSLWRFVQLHHLDERVLVRHLH